MDIVELAKLSPQILSIGAAIYLYTELRAERSAHINTINEWRKGVETLVERYHTFVTNHTVTLRELVEEMKKDEHQ